MNYRLHALGFLGGEEIKRAGVGNLGLQDREYRPGELRAIVQILYYAYAHRACRSPLGAQVHLFVWWGSHKSYNASKSYVVLVADPD